MDINVDQGIPRGDLVRFESGKYLYKLADGKFDIDRFNRDFNQYKDKRKQEMAEILNKKLEILNTPPREIPVYNLSIGDILVNMKIAFFNILDDILQFNFNINIFLKENRLFYIGLMLIIVSCLIYMYLIFSTTIRD